MCCKRREIGLCLSGLVPNSLLSGSRGSRHAMQVYIHREKIALIEVSFRIRIPRMFKRFAGLMVCAHPEG